MHGIVRIASHKRGIYVGDMPCGMQGGTKAMYPYPDAAYAMKDIVPPGCHYFLMQAACRHRP